MSEWVSRVREWTRYMSSDISFILLYYTILYYRCSSSWGETWYFYYPMADERRDRKKGKRQYIHTVHTNCDYWWIHCTLLYCTYTLWLLMNTLYCTVHTHCDYWWIHSTVLYIHTVIIAEYTVLYCTVHTHCDYWWIHCTVLYCTYTLWLLMNTLYCTVLYIHTVIIDEYTVLYCTYTLWLLMNTL